jgi:spore germination cell wall hydrolase CwlJ-like protein
MKLIMGILALLSFNTLATPPKDEFNYADFKCMVENAYHEARGEGIKGMQAVTQVVLNRAQKSGESACQVVYKPYQFSWTMDKKRKVKTDAEWATGLGQAASRLAVWQVLNDAASCSKLCSATHYHTASVKPLWANSRKKVGRLGQHIFYNL